MAILGLDIGGANLKAAHSYGAAKTVPFALWKAPDTLHREIRKLAKQFPKYDRVGITMTGELCDCYLTKREGVNSILDQVTKVFSEEEVCVWLVDEGFRSVERAREMFQRTGASNWHVLASYCGRLNPKGTALLIDIGSTTTDIIPIVEGAPKSAGKTDHARLSSGELVYVGFSRTSLSMLNPNGWICRENFATMRDLMIVLGLDDENPQCRDTADGMPATLRYATNRIARLEGRDESEVCEEVIRTQASVLEFYATWPIIDGLTRVRKRIRRVPDLLLLSGSGTNFAHHVLDKHWHFPRSWRRIKRVMLSDKLGLNRSSAACAWALTQMAN